MPNQFQWLKRPNNSVIAYMRTGANGWQWLHKPNGSCLGYYGPSQMGRSALTATLLDGAICWGRLSEAICALLNVPLLAAQKEELAQAA